MISGEKILKEECILLKMKMISLIVFFAIYSEIKHSDKKFNINFKLKQPILKFQSL